MQTITFTATATFPKDAVLGFAQFMGYPTEVQQDPLTLTADQVSPVFIPNPQSAEDFVAQAFKQSAVDFASKYVVYQTNNFLESQREKAVQDAQAQVAQAISVTIVDTPAPTTDPAPVTPTP